MLKNYYRTIQLNPQDWDLALDANNNLAIATDKYAIAQDTASTCLTFSTEIIYATERGVAWKDIVGDVINSGFIKAQLQTEAMRVEVNTDAVIYLDFDQTKRILYGVIVVEDIYGNSVAISF